MQKICTGPMQMTPYRPWSEERKAAARARVEKVRGRPEWPADETARLLVLRSEGLSCAAIGARMGKTKGMIIGKLQRLASKEASKRRFGLIPAERTSAPPPLLALPAPAIRVARPPLATPPVIYLPGPVARVVVSHYCICVVLISLHDDRAYFLQEFPVARDANGFAMQTKKPPGGTYMVYEWGRPRLSVSWEPIGYETYRRIQRIAERDVYVA